AGLWLVPDLGVWGQLLVLAPASAPEEPPRLFGTAGVLLHTAPDQLAAGLQVTVGEAVHVFAHADGGSHARDFERALPRVDADVVGDAVAVAVREIGRYLGHLREQVD